MKKSDDLRGLIEHLKDDIDLLLGAFLLDNPKGMDPKLFLADCEKNLKKKLKFNEEELEDLEEKIDERFPQGHEPMLTTIIPFGYYLGEVLRKKIPGAKWKISDEVNEKNDIMKVVLEFTDGNGHTMQAMPFKRVIKYWRNREDRMSSFVKMIEMTTEVQLDPDYWGKRADEDGWILMANDTMFRMFIGDKNSKGDHGKMKGAFHNGTFEDGK